MPRDLESHYTEVYRDQAECYDENRFGDRRGQFDRDHKNAVVLRELDARGLLREHANIADLAAGTGRITHELAGALVSKVIAVDITSEMLAVNEQALPEAARGRVDYLVTSMKSLDLPDASVDGATIGSFFYLIPLAEYSEYVRDIHRALKPGGVLIVEVSNALMLCNPRNFLHVVKHRHLQRRSVKSHPYPWELRRLFAPFRVTEIIGVSYPVVSRSFGRYTAYSTRLGQAPMTRYIGGKYIVVLTKS